MNDDSEYGVEIGDGSSYVRLRRRSERRADDGMTSAEIEVRGGPFAGIVTDDTLVGVDRFCAELQSVYDGLAGRATLGSYEKFRLVIEGGRLGGIQGSVELYGSHVPLSKLAFEIELDQTFLPTIIRDLKREFPEG